jgi:uracil-DNA glycosylase family 4
MRFDRSEKSKCNKCPLNGQTTVWGIGPIDAKAVIIGEAPGREEDLYGEPFVGPAGKLLKSIINNNDVRMSPNNVWFTNVISCRPPNNNVSSLEAELAVECCRAGFRAELEWLKQQNALVFCPVGNTAKNAFGISESITKARGSVYLVDDYPVIPTFHPSFILRGQQKQIVTWANDLAKVSKLRRKKYEPPKEIFNIKPTLAEFRQFVEDKLQNHTILAADIETADGLDPKKNQIVVIGFAEDGQRSMSFPFLSQFGVPYWKLSESREAFALLRRLLKNGKTAWQNALFDVYQLEAKGYEVGCVSDDTLLAHHAIHPELPHNLGYITSIYGDTPFWKEGFVKRDGKILDEPDESVRTYNLRDCVVIHQVLPGLYEDLKEDNTLHIYKEYSMPLVRPVLEMMQTGLKIDEIRFKKWKKELHETFEATKEKIFSLCELPEGFNLSSNQHIAYLLFDAVPPSYRKARELLKEYEDNPKKRKDTKKYRELISKVEIVEKTNVLRRPKGTKRFTPGGSVSTAEDTLKDVSIAIRKRLVAIDNLVRFQPRHEEEREGIKKTLEFLNLFDKYNEVAKLISTYTKYEPDENGRIYPKFKIHGTATGRLSSNDPNMQNIPKVARKIFTVDPGNVMVNMDYSNLELRVLAAVAQDDVMQRVFDQGGNVHDENTKVFLKAVGKSTSPEGNLDWDTFRAGAKTYIFGRNYGGGLPGMYKRLMVKVPDLILSFEQLKQIDDAYFDAHPKYKEWYDGTVAELEDQIKNNNTQPRLINVFGRTRIFLGKDDAIVREGLNFPIQSAAGDLMIKTIIAVHKELREKELPAKLIGTVHDSLMVECKEEVQNQVMEIMERHATAPVEIHGTMYSFKVDFEVGTYWGSLSKVEL